MIIQSWRWVRCLFVCSCFAFHCFSARAESVPTPLKFTGKESYLFESVPLNTVGTIEFILQAPPKPNQEVTEPSIEIRSAQLNVEPDDLKSALDEPDTTSDLSGEYSQDETEETQPEEDDRYYLLTNATTETTRFSLFVDRDFTVVGIANDTQEAQLPVSQLDDGQPHHLVFVTHGELTEVFLDGNYAGYLLIGYGTQAAMPYRIGSWDGNSGNFVGELFTLRIWDRSLARDEFRDMSSTFGLPSETHTVLNNLVACSDFMNQRADILNLRPELQISQMYGSVKGTPFSYVIPHQYEITKIFPIETMASSEDGGFETLSDILIEFSGPNGQRMTLTEFQKIEQHQNQTAYRRALRRAAEFDLENLKQQEQPYNSSVDHAVIWADFLNYQDRNKTQNNTITILGIPYQILATQADANGYLPEKALRQPVARSLAQLIRQERDSSFTDPAAPKGIPPKLDFGERLDFELQRDEKTKKPVEFVIGFAGTYRDEITSVRLLSNLRSSKKYFSTSTIGLPPAFRPEPFVTRIPENAKCVGIVGFRTQYLQALALAYIDLPVVNPLIPSWSDDHDVLPQSVNRGRYVLRSMQAPIRDDAGVIKRAKAGDERAQHLIDKRDGQLHVHSNYTSYPVCQLRETIDGSLIICFDDLNPPTEDPFITEGITTQRKNDEDDHPTLPGKVHSVVLRRRNPGRPVFTGKDKVYEYAVALHENGSFTLSKRILDIFNRNSLYWIDYIYDPVMPYDDSGNANFKLPWGDTFSSDQRPVLSEFNALGYHIAKMDPRNYQLSSGTTHRLFQWPSDDSTDYQTTSTGKIIPHGYYYRNDREGMEKARSHGVSSKKSHQLAWNVNLGMNVGAPGAASFGMNESYSQETDDMFSSESGYSVSITSEAKYALVLDRSRVQLDSEFNAAVQRMAKLLLADIELEIRDIDAFIDKYGTHYPYAVTYGGIAYQEIEYSKSQMEHLVKQSVSMSASGSTTIEGVAVGGSAGGGVSESIGIGYGQDESKESVRTVGGDISKGGGWSLPDHDEVPALLDLRPIDELLSPLFFEDKIVWTKLRAKVTARLNQLGYDKSFNDNSFLPEYYEAKITKIENLTSQEFSLSLPVLINPLYQKPVLLKDAQNEEVKPEFEKAEILIGKYKVIGQNSKGADIVETKNYTIKANETLYPQTPQFPDDNRLVFSVPQPPTVTEQSGQVMLALIGFAGRERNGCIRGITYGYTDQVEDPEQAYVWWNEKKPSNTVVTIGKKGDENSKWLKIYVTIQKSSLYE